MPTDFDNAYHFADETLSCKFLTEEFEYRNAGHEIETVGIEREISVDLDRLERGDGIEPMPLRAKPGGINRRDIRVYTNNPINAQLVGQRYGNGSPTCPATDIEDTRRWPRAGDVILDERAEAPLVHLHALKLTLNETRICGSARRETAMLPIVNVANASACTQQSCKFAHEGLYHVLRAGAHIILLVAFAAKNAATAEAPLS